MQANRRQFLQLTSLGACGLSLSSTALWAGSQTPAADDPDRFPIGIQEYTFHRWLGSQLDHLDYPELVRRELGINHIEYWSRAFDGQQGNPAFVADLASRSTGEGMQNVLILVDEDHQLDDPQAAERAAALDVHKVWVDCAAQLGCDAIRINCRSGGAPQENLSHAIEGVRPLCDHAAGSGVKIVIEPHGGNSSDPNWLLQAMEGLSHPQAGLLPDFNNFADHDRYDAVARTLPYAPALCAKALDFDVDGNETRTDYFRMLKLVHDSDYAGVITIEYEGALDPITGVRKTRALIERALEAAAA